MRPPGPPIPVRALPPITPKRRRSADRGTADERARPAARPPSRRGAGRRGAGAGARHRHGPAPGQLLHRDAEAAYVVAAADEDVLVVHPRDIGEAARIAHLIGNLHRDIHVEGSEIVALADGTLAERLEKSGAPFERVRRPFHGKAPGEHAH